MIIICMLAEPADVYLVLADTLVPEPLIKDFIFKSSGASNDTLLDVSNGGGVLHYLNHTLSREVKTEGGVKYITQCL